MAFKWNWTLGDFEMSTPLDIAVRYLKRVHATNEKNIPPILKSSLRPRKHFLDPEGTSPSVFMTAGDRLDNTFFDPSYGNRNALIHYRIPKDWHRRHVVLNPHYQDMVVDKDPNWAPSYEANALDRKVADIRNGGRAVTYQVEVPNEFIEKICFGPNAAKCYDPRVLEEHIVNEAPNQSLDLWEWNYWEDFRPEYQDIFEKYGRK